MDSFFGIGTPELLVILILAGIVMGPKRIAEVARWLGKTTAYLQNISRGFAMQLKQELDQIDEGGEMKEMISEMRTLQKEVMTLRQQVQETATTAITQTTQSINESKEMIEQSIRPPTLGTLDQAEPNEAPTNGLPPPPEIPEPPADVEIPNVLEISEDPE